jgi:hypothetical protein
MYVCALQELLENGTVQHFMTRALTLISMHVQVSNTAAADDHVVDDGNMYPTAVRHSAPLIHCIAGQPQHRPHGCFGASARSALHWHLAARWQGGSPPRCRRRCC